MTHNFGAHADTDDKNTWKYPSSPLQWTKWNKQSTVHPYSTKNLNPQWDLESGIIKQNPLGWEYTEIEILFLKEVLDYLDVKHLYRPGSHWIP